ncbi:ribosomal protein L7/L12 [Sphingomonas sp. 7/4-4]|uniref:ribosomal protein L7/L12 n=1 Tax=Sphingomonas sp. 7/4-4 TaxID=3018446 RepID=UPI0022F3A804|nr:ribosomal protein L7/L12 [Sphingomonas sp. 7/4-4]WBY07300.1 ribosomal protein L7/L12 [Sphingomonas sp. 7/4-4]
MFVPIPILIAAGLVILVLIAMIARAGRRRDPLMGGAPPRVPVPVATLSPEVEREVRAQLAAGRKIQAIKIARDATHLGLKETKDLVEALERRGP